MRYRPLRNDRHVPGLLEELAAVRHSSITLLKELTDEGLTRPGIMNAHPVSVKALGYHIGGHELHYINIINERYLILITLRFRFRKF